MVTKEDTMHRGATSMSLSVLAAFFLVLTGCSGGNAVSDNGSDHGADVAGDADVTISDDVPVDAVADVRLDTDDSLADLVDDASDAVDDVDVSDVADVSDAFVRPPFDYREPWLPPAGPWSDCAADTGTTKTMAAKAAYYDWIGPKLHQEPKAGAHENVARMYDIQCDGPIPTEIVSDDQLPVCSLNSNENNGLWTSLYLASQCFRYGATQDPEALANVKRTLSGTYELMKITGVPGLYAREASDPVIAPMQTCPEDPMEYAPPNELTRGNNWVKVDTDGCFIDYDPVKLEWVKHPDSCTDVMYAGRCWKRNVSKDEYSGHAYAAGVCAKVVDDSDVRAMAAEILSKLAHHIINNKYWLTDWDGRPTRFGSMYAMSLDHFPGFNAQNSLAWIKSAAMVSGEDVLLDEYYDCLLQKSGPKKCIEPELEVGTDYTTYINNLGLLMGCDTNFDNVSMMMLAYMNWIWFEPSELERQRYRELFETASRGPDSEGRDIWSMQIPFYNFMIAAAEGNGLMTEERRGLMENLVEDGVCILKSFPETQIQRTRDNSALEIWCMSERYPNLAAEVLPIQDRCTSTFEWWQDVSQIEVCTGNPNNAVNPAGFLTPYWMGRYFGFISGDM